MLSRAVQRAGGGRIVLSPKTYMVGRQTPGAPPQYRYEPTPLIELEGLPLGITIEGNGGTLRANPGLRFGSFDEHGTGLKPQLPFYDGRALATPYRFMIRISRSLGPVLIQDVELDGNIEAMILGGEWGDTGWQIPMSGIGLFDNIGSETVRRVYLHNHGQDGLIIDGANTEVGASRKIELLRSFHNGRQGCSIVGGNNYRFTQCEFSHTGRSAIASAPGAGVDLEAEGGKQVRDISFSFCTFDNNFGAGMVADSGPTEGVAFFACRFVGRTNWSAWPSKPRFRFGNCEFAGGLVRAYASDEPALASQFTDCFFADYDPRSGFPCYGSDGSVPIVDLGGSFEAGRNVAFVRCLFDLRHQGKLPWTGGTIYDSVKMRQRSKALAYPRGVYRGVSEIEGPAILASTTVEGTLLLNGEPIN
ncbi:MAG: hypothetical protein DI591_11895 [Citromicrobium sp.]|nr:MAG: hypothetical protein DI591_11895 [Citromicrobium sp.]